MNKHNAKDYLPFVQALAEGKVLKMKWADGTFQEVSELCFNHPPEAYRIEEPATKPTPTITPGKWRMRNGEIITIEAQNNTHWPWTTPRGSVRSMEWGTSGNFLLGTQDDHDLLTRVETRWRAWRPEEVPLGKEVRHRVDKSNRMIIASVTSEEYARLYFNNWELLLPSGTYAPCGVEEVVG